MANEVYTRTNQALFFARKAIASWHEVSQSGALDTVTLSAYHREHALFHLYRGVLGLIHEVADRYRWPLMDARSVEAVLLGDVAARCPGPELAELSELAGSADTWLGRLLGAWQKLQAPPVPQEAKSASDDLIIASSAVAGSPEWSREDAQEAVAALAERVNRYREGMVEW
ncbi:hypothetical protein SAMN05216421_1423 [Halopseudomonas xinjiangensis]|uniref:PasA protein n=1 Tax=Halopseudomonas xinjiangensis TaxID=487184 RepID=A0A1H1RR64_9GAMM|nr:DUF6586 family protein [Halopseudomonas xinjiangensis]SDS38218.1 hypothetical protein SAMN05216421_1423 [Halopseudomonas xinjiangensis]